MRILRTKREDIILAAESVGVALYEMERITKSGVESYKARLIPKSDHYRKWSREGRRIHAICYHGHYHFMRMIFTFSPESKIRSAHARYDNMDELFENELEYENIGSQFMPRAWGEACQCSQEDIQTSIDGIWESAPRSLLGKLKEISV